MAIASPTSTWFWAAASLWLRVTASYDAESEELIFRKYINVGVAVDTDRGLLVPVVRDAASKGLRDISMELSRLGESARAGDLRREQLVGGTFTLTNVGPLGGTVITPMINPPRWPFWGQLGHIWHLGSWEPRTRQRSAPGTSYRSP